jgi:hypothetical protein
VKTEAASVSAVQPGNKRKQKPATVEDREREGDGDVAVDNGAMVALHAVDDVHGAAHARASLGVGALKPPLGLGKRKRKDTGSDEPMYRRAEAVVMETLWCEPVSWSAWFVIRCSLLMGWTRKARFRPRKRAAFRHRPMPWR